MRLEVFKGVLAMLCLVPLGIILLYYTILASPPVICLLLPRQIQK
jgi:hypothetical protein